MTAQMTGLPSNYMNQQYWQYLSQLMAQQQKQQQTQQTSIYDAMQLQQAQLEQQQSFQKTDVERLLAAQKIQPGERGTGLTVPKGDGADDGKISFGSKLKNMGKGVVNFFKGMVCDESGKFSIKRTLTTVAVAAGAVALTVATGGAATPFLIAGGVALGGAQVVKGGIKAATAKTDAEAENAWQDIGSGTTAVVGAVAGAKGALKSSGAAIPKGNWFTSSVRATGECFKTAGKGSWAAMKSLRHPKTAWADARGYYQNTVKPNMQNAFGAKNARNNFQESVNKKEMAELQKINDKAAKINEELAKPDLKPEKIAKLNAELEKLQTESLTRASKVIETNSRKAVTQEIESRITQNEAKIADATVSTAEKARLKVETDALYNDLVKLDAGINKNMLNKMAEARKAGREILEENIKNAATPKDKADAKNALKAFDEIAKFSEKNQKLEYLTDNMKRAKQNLQKVENELKVEGLADARKAVLEGQKSKLKGIIASDKRSLFKVNAEIAAKKHLPQVGTAYGAYYLANRPNPIEGNQEMSEEEMLQLMQQQMLEQQAIPENNYNAAMQNPYAQYAPSNNIFGAQMPQGTGLGFNDLYVSPYPPMI